MSEEGERRMRRFGIVGLLVGLLMLGGVGFAAYQLGVDEGTTSAAVEAGASVVYDQGGGGFPFVGLLFGLLSLGFVIALVKRTAFGRAGRQGYGPGFGPGFGPGRGSWGGPWGGRGPGGAGDAGDRPVPPPFDAMLGRWHAEAHGQAATDRAEATAPAPAPAADPRP